MKNVLLDSNIFIYSVVDDSVYKFKNECDLFFESTLNCHYSIHTLTDIVSKELKNKYSLHFDEYLGKITNLEKLKKLTKHEVNKNDIHEIIQIKKTAQENNFNLSFEDSAFYFYAKIKKICLVTYDSDLFDFSEENKVEVARAADLIID